MKGLKSEDLNGMFCVQKIRHGEQDNCFQILKRLSCERRVRLDLVCPGRQKQEQTGGEGIAK